jgi:L-ascorbate metabolism protein UlaG (beta-lactamase superfamily)
VKNVGVKGFLSETAYEGKSLNTIYLVNFEGMNLAFLGALSNPALSTEAFEALEEIDILFTPIGGEGVLDPASAYKLAVSLEPSYIIPTHFNEKTLKQFLKESGDEQVKPIDKLVIKKKDLEGKKSEVVVLKEE